MPGAGYQIKLTEAIEGFSLCDWYVNDIPEDNIVSLQDSIGVLNSEILDLECVNLGACFFNHELNTCNYPSEGYDCEGNMLPQYLVGDFALGGIVFYVDETGEHGLVATMDDSAIDDSGAMNWMDAIGTSAIDTYSYDDWYLPSLQELQLMYNTIGLGGTESNIGVFASVPYWSSSEINFSYAWCVDFENGTPEEYPKGVSIRVRVIRAF